MIPPPPARHPAPPVRRGMLELVEIFQNRRLVGWGQIPTVQTKSAMVERDMKDFLSPGLENKLIDLGKKRFWELRTPGVMTRIFVEEFYGR